MWKEKGDVFILFFLSKKMSSNKAINWLAPLAISLQTPVEDRLIYLFLFCDSVCYTLFVFHIELVSALNSFWLKDEIMFG